MNFSDSQLHNQHINSKIKNVVGQISMFWPPQTKLNNILPAWNPGQSCSWKMTTTTKMTKCWDLIDIWNQIMCFYISNALPWQPFRFLFSSQISFQEQASSHFICAYCPFVKILTQSLQLRNTELAIAIFLFIVSPSLCV